jgi:hypothetical protein
MSTWRFTLVHTATGCLCGATKDFEVALSWFAGEYGFGIHRLLANKGGITQTITTSEQLHTLAVLVNTQGDING